VQQLSLEELEAMELDMEMSLRSVRDALLLKRKEAELLRTQLLEALTKEAKTLREEKRTLELSWKKEKELSQNLDVRLANAMKDLQISQDSQKKFGLVPENLATLDLTDLTDLESKCHDSLRAVSRAKEDQLKQQMEELKSLKRAKEVLEDQKLCVVCADSEIHVVLLPCRHRCLCRTCAPVLKKCPICRKEIGDRIETF